MTNLANSLIDLISSRRSVSPKRLLAPGPTDAQVDAIIRAALTAPDHGGLRPWRFVYVLDQSRSRLAEAFVKAKLEDEPGAADAILARAQEHAHNAPCLIAVIACLTKARPDVPISEQYISLGAAVQNMLLAAHAFGFGAMLVSGNRVRTKVLFEAFELADSEALAGFVSVGTIAKPPKDKARAQISDHLSDW